MDFLDILHFREIPDFRIMLEFPEIPGFREINDFFINQTKCTGNARKS